MQRSENLWPVFLLMTICLALQAGILGFTAACAYLSGSELREARDVKVLAQENLDAAADTLARVRARLARIEKENP